MVNNDYAKAYTEVLEILKCIPKDDFDKIPKEKIEFYKKNMDKNYNYIIDESVNFNEQSISDITKAILANIFRDYWATEYQKERILAKEKYDIEKLEQEKKERYNSDNIFKNAALEEREEIRETALVEYKKQNFFNKILNIIMNFFKK